MSKKLKKSDIRKNSVLQISHSINKIKENERKYTAILVIFFTTIFIVIGYFSLMINNNNTIIDNQISYSTDNITLYSNVVNLNNLDILNDEEGKIRNNYPIKIVNESSKEIDYIIKFIYDTDIIEKCNCQDIQVDYSNIKYSIDKDNINTFDDKESMIITEKTILPNEKQLIDISMWLQEQESDNQNIHLHGKFILEKK